MVLGAQPSSWLSIVQLTPQRQWRPLLAVVSDRLRPTIDPGTAHKDLAPGGQTGKAKNRWQAGHLTQRSALSVPVTWCIMLSGGMFWPVIHIGGGNGSGGILTWERPYLMLAGRSWERFF